MARQKLDSLIDLQGPNTGVWLQQLSTAVNEYLTYNYVGEGSPEGVVTAPMGSVYHNKTGGANVSIYVKETEVSTPDSTGWVAK